MKEKTVLITGSSKGLGKSIALTFAKNKYNIILHGRDKQRLKQVEECVLENNVNCDIVRGDITSQETIDRLYKAAVRRNIDILINNAGIYACKPFQNMEPEEFRRVIEVNLIAPVFLTKKIFPLFQRKNWGLIVNINSAAGKNPSDGEAAYCASKHGLRGFMRSFQFEANKYNVKVIDVYLGAMNTAMVENRKDPQKCIHTSEAADLIYGLCKDHPSMRISEIDIYRRKY